MVQTLNCITKPSKREEIYIERERLRERERERIYTVKERKKRKKENISNTAM